MTTKAYSRSRPLISSQRALNFEIPVLSSGGLFRERTEFEGESDTPRFRFEEDGTFEV